MTSLVLLNEEAEMIQVNPLNLWPLALISALFLIAGIASGQSTDEKNPTGIATFPVAGKLGPGTYYYSVLAGRGRVNVALIFTPPEGGGSMSVSISGPTCCGADAYVGGDSGTSATLRRDSVFSVPNPQRLLLTVYVSIERTQTLEFKLALVGSIVGKTPTSVCSDLRVSSLMRVSIAGKTRTVRGDITNWSENDFRSAADRQWVEISTGAKESFISLARIPFTEVLAGRRFSVTATHTSATRVTPRYTIRIIYSPLNATDDLTTNDDCNPANDSVTGSGQVRDFPLTKKQ